MAKKHLFAIKYSIIIMLASATVAAHLNDESDDGAWQLLQSGNSMLIDAAINPSNKFIVKFSSEKNRYELSYDDKYIGHGDIGIGCHLQGSGIYNCVAFNSSECSRATYGMDGKEIKGWEKDTNCGLNNTSAAIKIFETLDKNLRIGTVSDYYAVRAEHNWKCAAGQELWALKNSSDNKFLLSTNLLPHYISFLYDEDSRRDSSYCIEKVGENQYKIQARETDAYINDGYLNQAGSEFDRKKETAGIFSITLIAADNTTPDHNTDNSMSQTVNTDTGNPISDYKILPALTTAAPVDNLVTLPQAELPQDLEVAVVPNDTTTDGDNEQNISQDNQQDNTKTTEIKPTSTELKQYLENIFQIILILVMSMFFLFIGTRGGPGPGKGPKAGGGADGIGDIGGGGASGNW